MRQPVGDYRQRGLTVRYALLWLLGIPIPLLIVIWLLFH